MDALSHPLNPCRRPDWRAVRAIYLAEQIPRRLRAERHDDYFVRAYRHYAIEMIDGRGDEQRRSAVCRELPHIHEAHELRFKSELRRSQILEAWLLTRSEFARIADRVGVETAVVEHYEKLFFSVRDRLDCSDWIAKIIKGPAIYEPTNWQARSEHQRGVLYRVCGFYNGPEVLHALTSAGLPGHRPENSGDSAEYFREALSNAIGRHASVTAGDLAIDRSTIVRVLNLARARIN